MRTAKEVLYEAMMKHAESSGVPTDIAESISRGISENQSYQEALKTYAAEALDDALASLNVVKVSEESSLKFHTYDDVVPENVKIYTAGIENLKKSLA